MPDEQHPAQHPASTPQHPAQHPAQPPAPVAAVPTITIGRDGGNDVPLDDPLVSRWHARVELRPDAAVLADLDSFRGTQVNARSVRGPVALAPGDVVTVGNQRLRWSGSALEPAPADADAVLVTDRLGTVTRDGKQLLRDVSLRLRAGSLTAIIGPSGAGKSTLLGALTGLRPATHGGVRYLGEDLYASYDELKYKFGLVPQQDIQHGQLTVRQALGFAAELRLPPDTTAAERQARVDAVAARLGLTERMGNRIGSQLSGGQRKRVSIATELLTAPPLLFLDEPTSGLDPGLDVEVMRQLRGLADDGRVIVVVTHSVLALDTCDEVVVLAPGGRVAYAGPPSGVLAHFGCASYPEVFAALERGAAETPAPSGVPPAPPAPASTADAAGRSWTASAKVPPFDGTSAQVRTSQLRTLLRRNVAVVAADRLLLSMLVLMPVALGVLSRVVPGGSGLSLLRAPLGPGGYLNPEQATKKLTILIIAGVLMGLAMAIRELVGERPIFQREAAVGLSPDVYLLSKILVLGAAAAVQGVVVTVIATALLPGPDFGGDLRLGRIEVAMVIAALAFSMAVLGLLLSAVVTSTEQSMPALVGMVMVQLVLSGSLVEVAGRPLLAQLSWLAPARWAYAACSSITSLQRPRRQQFASLDWIGLHGAGHWIMAMFFLAVLTAGTAWVALLAVRRSAVPR